MTANECSVADCGRPICAGGYCRAHYQQVRAGKTPGPIRRARGSATERDEQGRKWCSSGKHWTAPDTFATDRTTVDGLQRRCTPCMTLGKFGLTRAQYEVMLAAQNGGCAICGGTNSNGNALAVDHDHGCCAGKRSCGRCVRALLCSNCNVAVGLMKEQPQRLRDAAAYLERFTPSVSR